MPDFGPAFALMPDDALPFSSHPRFGEFYTRFEILLQGLHRLLYVAPPGESLSPERIGPARRGIPRAFTGSGTAALVETGRQFAGHWNRRFADVLGRAGTFFPVLESDVFVPAMADHVRQIRNSLLLMGAEVGPLDLLLFESMRILKNVSHVRVLGPHDRLQDSLVVVAAMNHLLALAATLRSDPEQAGLWDEPLPSQRGYRGDFRLTVGELVSMTIVRGMDPDLFDTESLTPRALMAEEEYRPDALRAFGRAVWAEGPVTALLHMFIGIPDRMHEVVDELLTGAFARSHASWQADPWLQSPYTSVTTATATQIFLNVLSVPFNQPLPLAEVGLFPVFRQEAIGRLTDGATEYSRSLASVIQPTPDSLADQTLFGVPDDFPREGFIHGPAHRRHTAGGFGHMPGVYRSTLGALAGRMRFKRLQALLDRLD